jgi:hypothetical protein
MFYTEIIVEPTVGLIDLMHVVQNMTHVAEL